MVKGCNNAALNSAMQGLSQAFQNWTGLFMSFCTESLVIWNQQTISWNWLLRN